MSLKIIPAIDLINKKCVRLEKGDFAQEKIYSDSPLEVAKNFETSGAKYLHIVDLDGAKNENSSQSKIIIEIAKNTKLKIQTGGGIRSAEKIKELLDAGINKIVIGSLAVKNPELVKTWMKTFGAENFVLAFDVRIDGNNIPMTSTSGWQKDGYSLWKILEEYISVNISDDKNNNINNKNFLNILCTDINRDGMLQGPNFELYAEIKKRYPEIILQASGGIASLENLKKLRDEKIDEVIIGKALYEKRFTLEEALKC
ncbi:MAG: 1-(5-phosphoribosyl)-5-[(5-phosphoribosylamino)methylideneamino]imidazole-4-carboxamide isomerase [Fusobacteriaceae bacterium]